MTDQPACKNCRWWGTENRNASDQPIVRNCTLADDPLRDGPGHPDSREQEKGFYASAWLYTGPAFSCCHFTNKNGANND